MADRLQGRVVMITGAAKGLGASYAVAAAREGASVAVCDIVTPEGTVAAIREAGGTAMGHVFDVRDRSAVEGAVAETVRSFGGLHGLVNNASLFATLERRPFEEIPSEEFDLVLSVNVRGSFECLRAVTPTMRSQGYGKVVNVISGTIFKGTPLMLSYVSSKGALLAMTRAAARELGADGIRVNCLAPGLTVSDGTLENPDQLAGSGATVQSRCLKRDQMPEDLNGTIIHLLSHDTDFVTGQTFVVDGGSVMP